MTIPFYDKLMELYGKKDTKSKFLARQIMFLNTPLSKVIELYLNDNEGRIQKLDRFPMMRAIYDQLPKQLLLKCSRKTLKSTLLSNIITMNMIRYNHYKMLYLAPQELSTKYFSQNYLLPRFESPGLKKIVPNWIKNDVFEKKLDVTESSVLLRYAKEDATRTRGPATDENFHDEIQDINFDILPIIRETMSLSEFKRETFAGTPLTTDNTINVLWRTSTQFEWVTKCAGCNHWNSLTIDNEPLKMIGKDGLSCSRCSKVLDTSTGQWASFNPGERDMVGYHLAQPILPHFNQTIAEWTDIYKKVNNKRYNIGQIHNEVFGIAWDTGRKPINEEFLKTNICILDNKDPDPASPDKGTVFTRGKGRYHVYTCGVDWGVNMETSRTSVCLGGLRDDLVYEVFFCKVYNDFDYDGQIRDIANRANAVNAFCASDSGPDPNRGIKLCNLTSPTRSQLIRYEHGNFIQRYHTPPGSIDWRQNRWCLHRSDTMTLVFNLLKQRKILFPRWDDCSEEMQDILNVYVEVKEGNYGRQDLFYRHSPDAPDDFMHALNFAACQAYYYVNDPLLQGPSSSANDENTTGGAFG